MHPLRSILPLMLLAPCLAGAQASQDLSLEDAVALALEKNMNLHIQRYDPLIAQDSLTVEEAAFDIQLEASGGLGEKKSAYDGDTTSTGYASAGASKKISTGAVLGLSTTLDHSSAITTKDSGTGLKASITQPLLKGAWSDVTLADMRKASSELSQSQLKLRATALDLVLDTTTLYWNLSYAKENVALLESSVRSAELLVEESRAKLDAGLVSEIDLLQAQASLAEKREALTQAELSVAEAADALAQGMGTLLELSGTSFEPGVSKLPEDLSKATPFAETWPVILEQDLDSAMQEEVVRRADLDRVKAMNGRLPQVDLVLETGVSGAAENERRSYSSLADPDGHEWSTELKFSMPLGRRADIAKARQASARLEQAKIKLISIKETLYKNARQTWRDLQLGIDRCNSGKARVDYQKMALEKARSSYSANLISFRELLEAQQDYDDAQLGYLDALRDLAVARATMARLDGTLFDGTISAHTSTPDENISK
ncbi:MAG: TolC family protein [Opitutales bacterium]|nr:TolC family protein [Opitutales bacterium]